MNIPNDIIILIATGGSFLVLWFIAQALDDGLIYITGFALLKSITIGKYPAQFIPPVSATNQRPLVVFAGGFFWLSVAAGLVYVFSY